MRNGLSSPVRENQAIIKRSRPSPNQTVRPFRSTRVTRPSRFSNGTISLQYSATPSPRMIEAAPCRATTLCTTRFSTSGRTKATTSPTPGRACGNGDTVITSPSLMKGVMLHPRAQNRKGTPLAKTALMSSSKALPESGNSLASTAKSWGLSNCLDFNKHPPPDKLFYKAEHITLDVIAGGIVVLGKCCNNLVQVSFTI